MKHILFFLFAILQFSTFGQTTINGIVTDSKNNPIRGTNIYLNGTYDVTAPNDEGKFSYTTSKKKFNLW